MAKRLLITGSRGWDDVETIEKKLYEAIHFLGKDEEIVLISGNCPTGADYICEILWETTRRPVIRIPADWERYGKKAGFIRNGEMVKFGADLCLAFIKNRSKGATMTANLAIRNNINTWIVVGR